MLLIDTILSLSNLVYYVSQNRSNCCWKEIIEGHIRSRLYSQQQENPQPTRPSYKDFAARRYSAHMNHFRIVMATFPPCTHGLHADDVARKDRQKWEVQHLKFLSVQTCLLDITQGNNSVTKDVSVYGTRAFLYVAWHYIKIFFSPHASLCERLKYAAFVAIFFSL